MRLAIIGGGGFRVPLIHRELVRRPELGVSELVLYDALPERVSVISAVLERDAGPAVRVAPTLIDAVAGADFVFSAIRVGGLAERAADERRALRLGLVGQETVGAGGLAYPCARYRPRYASLARSPSTRPRPGWSTSPTRPA